MLADYALRGFTSCLFLSEVSVFVRYFMQIVRRILNNYYESTTCTVIFIVLRRHDRFIFCVLWLWQVFVCCDTWNDPRKGESTFTTHRAYGTIRLTLFHSENIRTWLAVVRDVFRAVRRDSSDVCGRQNCGEQSQRHWTLIALDFTWKTGILEYFDWST